MLALLSDLPCDQDSYSFEYKWDGVRAIAFWDGSRLRLQSRNLLDITHSYPELAALGRALGRRRAILDGEIVALDENGLPSFALLQNRMHVVQPSEHLVRRVPVLYMLFDVLHSGSRSTMNLPFVDRREILESLTLKGANWEVSPAHIGEGAAMLHAARQTNLEGIVAKYLPSIYEPGRRSSAWIKTKVIFGQEFVIGGWTPQADNQPSRIGSLLIGYFEGEGREKKLRYAGSVGSGFTESTHLSLLTELAPLTRASSPFADKIPKRGAVYVQPQLVAEVEYRRWPAGGMVQQAAFKGLRWDKPAANVVKEDARLACVPPPNEGGRRRLASPHRAMEK